MSRKSGLPFVVLHAYNEGVMWTLQGFSFVAQNYTSVLLQAKLLFLVKEICLLPKKMKIPLLAKAEIKEAH